MPLVSVVMSTYNGEAFLKEAVDSILGQTLTDLEFIIIDDGSTDGTAALLADYQDPRIRMLSQDNQGLARGLNRGIQEARGQYIARMDDDDVSHPGRLAAQLGYLEHHSAVGVLGTWFHVIDEKGLIVGTYQPAPRKVALLGTVSMHNPLCHSSVMLRKSVLGDVGGYREYLRYAQDYELWLRIARHGYHVAVIPEVLHRFRITLRGVTKYAQQKQIARQVGSDKHPNRDDEDLVNSLSANHRLAFYHYSIGVTKLRGRGPSPMRSFAQSLIHRPFYPRTWLWLLISLLPRSVRDRLLLSMRYLPVGRIRNPKDDVSSCGS